MTMLISRRRPDDILSRWPDLFDVFDGFDPSRLAHWGQTQVRRTLTDTRGSPERCFVQELIVNAQCWRALDLKGGAARWIWDHVSGHPVQSRAENRGARLSASPLSRRVAEQMRTLGFQGMSPSKTLMFLETSGVVNGHVLGCPRGDRLAGQRGRD